MKRICTDLALGEIPDGTGEKEEHRQLLLLRERKNTRLLARVEKQVLLQESADSHDRYEPQNDYERSLVSAMKEGLDFLSPEHGIMQYSYDPFYEEEPECLPMYLWQQIRVVYDSNDMVTDYLVDYYNSYSRETYDIIPATTLALSPETEKLFYMDDYPERFLQWADKFINIII